MKIVLWYKYGFCHVIVIFAYKSNYSASIWKTDSYKLNIGNYSLPLEQGMGTRCPRLGEAMPKRWGSNAQGLGRQCPRLGELLNKLLDSLYTTTIFIHSAAYTIEKGHASFGNVPYI